MRLARLACNSEGALNRISEIVREARHRNHIAVEGVRGEKLPQEWQ